MNVIPICAYSKFCDFLTLIKPRQSKPFLRFCIQMDSSALLFENNLSKMFSSRNFGTVPFCSVLNPKRTENI